MAGHPELLSRGLDNCVPIFIIKAEDIKKMSPDLKSIHELPVKSIVPYMEMTTFKYLGIEILYTIRCFTVQYRIYWMKKSLYWTRRKPIPT